MNYLIIDGFGLAFRGHFSHIEAKTSSGLLSGCIYGFLSLLKSLKKKYASHHFIVAWDTNSTRKKEIFPEYKANRPKFSLSDQIQDLKEAVRSINMSQAEFMSEEADDVIASLAFSLQKDNQVYIYSSDKDLLQLVVDGKTIVIRPGLYGSEDRFYDEAEVKKDFGVAPAELSCYLSFRGDNADNIPGVPRLPSKIISDLSSKYKEPKAVYSSMDKEVFTKFQKESLQKSEAQVYVNFSLIKLKSDLDVTVEDGVSDVDKLKVILDKYEIKSIPAEALVRLFESESSFNMRTAPQIVNYSLF